jgi:hypothetical protein
MTDVPCGRTPVARPATRRPAYAVHSPFERIDVDVRIGVTQAPRELTVEIDDTASRDELKAKLDAALAGDVEVLWLTDRRGRDVAVPAAKIAYIELGLADSDRRIGFGG